MHKKLKDYKVVLSLRLFVHSFHALLENRVYLKALEEVHGRILLPDFVQYNES